MKNDLRVPVRREVLAMAAGITYSVVPDWYDATCRNLTMNLIFPKYPLGHAPQPCLLFLCGGAYSVVNSAVWLPELMYFAERGYTVATIDYRTSNQPIFPAALIDAKSAVRFLKAHAAQFAIDPARIAISGESAGGTLAALVGATAGNPAWEQGDWLNFDSSVAAVVDYYGPVDLIASAKAALPVGGDVADWTLSAFLGAGYGEAQARAASAICHVGKDTPPFMLLHGTDDPVVNIHEQSDAMYDRLVECGVRAEYLRLEGAGHGDAAFYQDEVKARVLDFLDRVFGGK